jgi:hypothetical protein
MVVPFWFGMGCRSRIDGRIHRPRYFNLTISLSCCGARTKIGTNLVGPYKGGHVSCFYTPVCRVRTVWDIRNKRSGQESGAFAVYNLLFSV